MLGELRKHDGVLNKFLGDGIMCFFNAPYDDPEHAVHAVRTVLEFLSAGDSIDDVGGEITNIMIENI